MIEPVYTDYFGNEHIVSEETTQALLSAMGLDEPCHPELVKVTKVGEAVLPPDVRTYEIVLEDGDRFHGDTRELPLGYHHLTLDGDDGPIALIVVPSQCYVPPELETGERWALATQLYSLRSGRNWGIGDFRDLADLARIAGAAGAGAIALNPLHELHPSNPAASSPYSPASRLFLNGAYLDVSALGDWAPEARLRELRASEFVDYAGVAAVKREALERSFAAFRSNCLERTGDRRAGAFRAFLRERGEPLQQLARYEALTEYFHARDANSYGWQQWPVEYGSPDSHAVERFAREHRGRVDFYAYIQWLADEQLAGAAATARANGVGLYRDLAVGADLNSADAWADQTTIVAGASLGAPPDHLNAQGQNWGLPPFSPVALRQRAYAPFAGLLRANMRHASILRVDHVMALRRGFWIPRGKSPRDGAYVRYPFEEMLGILALESVRNRCTIVGEDLGTLPEGFRERLRDARALSSRLVYFERNLGDGSFDAPNTYPRLAAASIGTHDLPPLAGWWTGDELALRARIALFPTEEAHRDALQERRHARYMLIHAMESSGACDGGCAARLRADAERGGTMEAFEDLVEAVHRFLAQTPSMLKIVALEDVLGEIDAINVPGTTGEHPNWQRKHSATIEELAGNERLATLASILGKGGSA